MTGFNVNCSDCKHCAIFANPDEDAPDFYVCMIDHPTMYEVDVINNTDCIYFVDRRTKDD